MSASALRRKVASEMLAPGEPGRLAVTFCSFGHKHGPARDADIVLDVRFLRTRTGSPTCARSPASTPRSLSTSRATAASRSSTTGTLPLLEYLLPQYAPRGSRTS